MKRLYSHSNISIIVGFASKIISGMRMAVVPAMLIAATLIALLIHRRQMHREPSGGEAIVRGLAGIDAQMNKGQTIFLKMAVTPAETFLWARFVVAPRHIALFDAKEVPDTVLLISAEVPDSFAIGKTKLWESADGPFHFQLLRTKP